MSKLFFVGRKLNANFLLCMCCWLGVSMLYVSSGAVYIYPWCFAGVYPKWWDWSQEQLLGSLPRNPLRTKRKDGPNKSKPTVWGEVQHLFFTASVHSFYTVCQLLHSFFFQVPVFYSFFFPIATLQSFFLFQMPDFTFNQKNELKHSAFSITEKVYHCYCNMYHLNYHVNCNFSVGGVF